VRAPRITLDLTHEQVVLRLQRHRAREAAELGEVDDLLDLPTVVVGQPGIGDLAGAERVVEEAQRLVQRGVRVEGVQLVEVDGVDPEPTQRGVQPLAQVAAGESGVVGPSPIGKRALVASTTWLRTPAGCLASRRPTISSAAPLL
jgi:hypothetical protein